MCLFTKQICPLRARRDIVCYKCFLLRGRVLVSPYRGMKAYLGSTMKAYPLRKNFGEQCTCIDNLTYRQRISEGFIHAFVDKPKKSPFIVVKCIIPKGTLYYKSTNNITYLHKEICAKTIILKELCGSQDNL